MTIGKADVVVSRNGRDEGKRFIVIDTDGEYSLIADGKGRRVDKPKRKKNKHLKLEDRADSHITDKLTSGEKVTNNEIRRALAQYAADRADEGGM
ncbi:MAG: KOW domain-containing RNA-binding protein [Oscillospiraceae bacterium]|nr:KOW domain-containing RNA-binding protein [Oscillospiraceae bacterium]